MTGWGDPSHVPQKVDMNKDDSLGQGQEETEPSNCLGLYKQNWCVLIFLNQPYGLYIVKIEDCCTYLCHHSSKWCPQIALFLWGAVQKYSIYNNVTEKHSKSNTQQIFRWNQQKLFMGWVMLTNVRLQLTIHYWLLCIISHFSCKWWKNEHSKSHIWTPGTNECRESFSKQ